MKTIIKIATAAVIAVGAGSAVQAQSLSPQVPNPANPAPANPIDTAGRPLAYSAVPAEPRVVTGRSSAYDAGVLAAPFDFSANVARGAVGAAGGVVDGTVGPVVRGGRY